VAPTPEPAAGRPGPHNDLTDVAGVRVGHHQRTDDGWLTGTTVVLAPPATVGGVDVRGGGPSTRETDALAPTTLVDAVHAVCLSGGSSYGLAAASGVMDWLGRRGVGLPVGGIEGQVVPIVPAACCYDLRDGEAFARRPDAAFGAAAAAAAASPGGAGPLDQGNVGAGTGAHAGRLKGGIGSASVVLAGGGCVAALVAVNSSGSPVDPRSGRLHGAGLLLPGERPPLRAPDEAEVVAGAAWAEIGSWPGNTMLAVVATDTDLTAAECSRVAMAAHDGLARAVQPAHGMTDGDVVFALATRAAPLPDVGAGRLLRGDARPVGLGAVMAAAADTVTRAVVHAVLAARGAGGLRAYLDVYPSALDRSEVADSGSLR